MRRNWPLLLALYCFPGVNLLVSQPDFLLLHQKLTDTLEVIIAEQDIPGATAACVLPDGQLISTAAGLADREKQSLMAPGARMLLGSVGKVFVSAVFLQLVDEGKIDLDQKVSGYFPDADWFDRLPNAADLTVRSLLNHTSGLPRYVFDPAFVAAIKADHMRSWTPLECLSVILDKKALHPVGRGWAYSDTNYILLGMIIEKVTGQPYYDELQIRIVKPFYLRNTFPSNTRNLPGLTQAYIGNNFFELPSDKTITEDGLYLINPQFEWTGGGLMTNVEDMAYLLKWLHTGKVLTPATYEQLIRAVGLKDGQPASTGYGLGTFVWDTEIGKSYGHAGVMPGYLTQIEFFKDKGFAIAYQMNTDLGGLKTNHQNVLRLARLVAAFLRKR